MSNADRRPETFTAPALDSADGVVHGFFGRRGGVSTGLYSSLNCGAGSDDLPENVRENRSRLMSALGLTADALHTLYQVHGRDVVRIDGTEPQDQRPKADAMVSNAPGVALGILTADCVPVLFADPVAGVIGAAHAGWKGALSGVIDTTVDEMIRLGARAERIIGVLGPAIAAESYEVGPDFPDPFLAEGPDAANFFRPSARTGHHMFDLCGYVEQRLNRAGIGTVERLRLDTCTDHERFFSYRRATHQGEADYGRELSVIAFPG
jgi:polyphenol oxidase